MTKLAILNEIYIILNAAVEKDIHFNFPEFILIINKMLDNDLTFKDYCPIEFHNEIEVVKNMIDKYSDKKILSLEVSKLISAYSSVYEFEQCKIELSNIEKDKLYYKAAINSFYILELFTSTEIDRFESFKNEFFEVGVLIGKYYKDNTTVVKDIIISKLQELFLRYNFNYSLPTCCII